MTIFYPPETNAIQKTLDAQLLSGTTASMTLNNVTGIQDKKGLCVVDAVDANGASTPAKREYISFTGVSGVTLTGLTRNADGGSSDQDHAVSAIVQFVPDVLQQQELIDEFLVQHADGGVHSDALVTSLKATGAEVNTGTSDVTIVTPKALADSKVSITDKVETLTNKTLTSPKINEDVVLTATATELNAAVAAASTDGWIADSDTWVYVSASTFKVTGKDVTAKFTKGTRLKFTQTTVKYAVVVASSFSTDTTVTILVNTDYTIANATITSPYYSYSNPQSYPGWFAITAPTWDVATLDNGSGGQPTTGVYRGRVDGNVFMAKIIGSGTKAGTNWYFSFTNNGPVPANTTTAQVIGSCNAGWVSNDHNGVLRHTTGPLVYFTFDSDRTIADNQAMTAISGAYSYEI